MLHVSATSLHHRACKTCEQYYVFKQKASSFVRLFYHYIDILCTTKKSSIKRNQPKFSLKTEGHWPCAELCERIKKFYIIQTVDYLSVITM
jgi:hypothetical protein